MMLKVIQLYSVNLILLAIAWIIEKTKRGRILDVNHPVRSKLAVLIDCIVMMLVGNVYNGISARLCKWEGACQNSYIAKRAMLETLCSLSPLLYVSYSSEIGTSNTKFYSEELLPLYFSDELRRIGTESLIPIVLKLFRYNRLRKLLHDAKPVPSTVDFQVLEEMSRETLDSFDDYIEIMIQFGYIVLFSHKAPLLPMLSMIMSNVELRSDLFKMLYIHARKAELKNEEETAIWRVLFEGIVLVGIFSAVYDNIHSGRKNVFKVQEGFKVLSK